MGVFRRLAALLGISAYVAATPAMGPGLDDPRVEAIREVYGGQLGAPPSTVLRWYLADLEAAQRAADTGDLSKAAQLCNAMAGDGVYAGLMATRTGGMVRLPKRFKGNAAIARALEGRAGARSVFDDMFPPAELALLVRDGINIGVGVAELVPVDGRDFPVMVRLDPEYLRYRWNENRWYYQSIAGPIPITPGDGRWILHLPGGRIAPWRHGLWRALGRSFINKDHAQLHRSNWEAKLANPARVAYAPPGATEPQREGFLKRLIAWGINTVFELPVGWEVKIVESNGRGYESFGETIDRSDREFSIALAGQVVTVDGGAGFSNADIHASIRADLIQETADSLAYTLNTQGIPPWVIDHFGEEALADSALVSWDVTKPRDLNSEATSLTAVAGAITSLSTALAPFNRSVDVRALTERFGVPIEGDTNGDGEPDVEVDVDLDESEPANDDGIDVDFEEAA